MSGRGDDAFWRNEDGSVNVRILRENMPLERAREMANNEAKSMKKRGRIKIWAK